MILGTAGHIDHGKTALVRALTGVDTDRLPEERRRGITIELGFAPLELEGIGTVGVVDVPGHEAFVRTMVAGASGVDLALLVIAADEGIMPQTREHVQILDFLGVSAGVVALTKRDLVDDDWFALVEEDVRAMLATTALAGSPVVGVSAITGEGLDALRGRIREAAARVPARRADDLFRLPVDRAFTVRGTGTVVTGTISSGTVRPDSNVRVFPSNLVARVRGLQSHGAAQAQAQPGTRIALALAGVEVADVARGAVIVGDGAWTPARVVRADVSLLATAPVLRARSRVHLHIGTTEMGARVVSVGGPLEPGQLRTARLTLDHEIVTRAGDRFVLRTGSPLDTIGGGEVTDPAPPHRRARPFAQPRAAASRRLAWILSEAGTAGVTLAALPIRLGLPPAEVSALLAAEGGNRLVAGAVYPDEAVAALRTEIEQRVAEFHQDHALEPGAPLQELRTRVAGHPRLVEEVLAELQRDGRLEAVGGQVRVAGWVPRLSPELRALQAVLEGLLRDASSEPPSVSDLTAEYGEVVVPLLRLLGPDRVVQVEGDRFYHATVVETLVGRLRTTMQAGREYSPADLREVLGISRKFLIPFLEFCDRQRVTERRGSGRVLCMEAR